MPMRYSSFGFLCSAVIVSSMTFGLFPAVSFAQGQDSQPPVSAAGGAPVDTDSSEIYLGTEPVEGDLTITRDDTLLVLEPGEHVVNGNATINAQNNTLLVSFDKEKHYGSLKVNGSLNLGPENAPTLAVDLSSIGNLVPGEVFTIAFAGEVNGQFNGLSDGTTFETGEVKLRINYTANSIVITVISSRRFWDLPLVSRTPVIEFDNSLINPTSTEPGSW